MAATDDLLIAFELHSPDKIRAALKAGANPLEPIRGIPPLQSLVEMYSRSSRFASCLRVMLEAGARFDHPLLEPILLDDSAALQRLLASSPDLVCERLDLNCTFTSLKGVSPLHLCAEYNSISCLRVLLDAGADVNARAATDGEGLGGHTPIFHTVNSNGNFASKSMELLVASGATLDIRLKGLIWGGGFEWETVVYDVTVLSYAQCGLYRQFHRREEDVYSNIAFLHTHLHGHPPRIRNVPNEYLRNS